MDPEDGLCTHGTDGALRDALSCCSGQRFLRAQRAVTNSQVGIWASTEWRDNAPIGRCKLLVGLGVIAASLWNTHRFFCTCSVLLVFVFVKLCRPGYLLQR